MAFYRSEAAADRRDLLQISRSIKDDMNIFREKWAEETKEFHGRLCAIEEKYRQK